MFSYLFIINADALLCNWGVYLLKQSSGPRSIRVSCNLTLFFNFHGKTWPWSTSQSYLAIVEACVISLKWNGIIIIKVSALGKTNLHSYPGNRQAGSAWQPDDRWPERCPVAPAPWSPAPAAEPGPGRTRERGELHNQVRIIVMIKMQVAKKNPKPVSQCQFS